MHILLTGSTGFIGHTVARALTQAGHTVHGGISPRQHTAPHTQADALQVPMDFARDTTPAHWLPRLEGVDAVINTVGVLRDSRTRPIDAVHQHTPTALFDACAQAGVRRVVQISALGIAYSSTRYASTKRAADEHLQALAAQGALAPAILRPSVVFGKGGDSSALFMNLARLPVALFPGPMLTARVQPVSVHDLAAAIVALLGPALATRGIIECAGPEALTLGDFVASLRQQLGHRPAHVLRLPDPLTRLSARMGDAVPGVPWCSETLAMLGSDNVGNPAVFEQLLGRKGVHYSQLVATAWH
ncbi:NAD-dependent epimerase/dehydratase family protein [Acidovorax sp.]|uniref:NAD-dependent epimerase/dehydratase family protein n=1 Tax=Acidovorax sp. TaxID=1872122 RepID=UPI003918F757